MHSSYRRSEGFVARAVPSLLTLLVALLTAIPAHIFGSGEITPSFTLICIFYWGVYSPGALPYSFLFMLGLLQDALGGTPLGISSVIYLGMAYVLHAQRRLMGQALFGTIWMGCMLFTAMAALTQWGIMCLYSGIAYEIMPPLLRWVVTCIAYPPLHLLLTHVYKRIRKL
jgi:rod shape-determining protein MreD